MGSSFAKISTPSFKKKEWKILMLGLAGAGKTTILHKLELGEIVMTTPAEGFDVETVNYNNINITAWDVAGDQDKFRPLWRHYFQTVDALIFVVDSSDRERVDEARDELNKLLKEEELRDAVLLVLGNKQDLLTAVGLSHVAEKLGLMSLRSRVANTRHRCYSW